jgi:hypothetical protein
VRTLLARHWRLVIGFAVVALSAAPARASFHVMQIEQAIGGVCGNTSRQAIQLRMRTSGQNFVAGKKLRAWDAAGINPVVLITFPSNAPSGASLGRILVTSTGMASSAPGLVTDFTLTNLIPASYLAAGRLTFEDSSDNIYWSLAWGGAGYTGSNAGDPFHFNDADGNFGPPFSTQLPFTSATSLSYGGVAGGPSTNNAADYVLSSPATLTNNAGTPFAITDCLFGDAFDTGNLSGWSGSTP